MHAGVEHVHSVESLGVAANYLYPFRGWDEREIALSLPSP
jgi:hypothetical protein